MAMKTTYHPGIPQPVIAALAAIDNLDAIGREDRLTAVLEAVRKLRPGDMEYADKHETHALVDASVAGPLTFDEAVSAVVKVCWPHGSLGPRYLWGMGRGTGFYGEHLKIKAIYARIENPVPPFEEFLTQCGRAYSWEWNDVPGGGF